MKTFIRVLMATMLLFAPAYAFSAGLGYMRISYIEGDVQVKTPEAGEWGGASINAPLAEGDEVWTPAGSRAELQLNNGTYIRLDGESALQILSIDNDSSQFYLAQGGAYVYYDAPQGSVVQIDSPDASVRAFSRGIFRLDMTDRYTDVAVYKGYVKTENSAGLTRINAGQMLSLGRDTSGELAPLGPADEWEDWNNARNQRVLARRDGGSRYLPADLQVYAADFDANGRWVQAPEYGQVWTPTVAVSVDWAPYRKGRWIWRGGDYVWVGLEPWGWAPYHYGRWAFVASFGWCWVPPAAGDIYWSPGYVGWVRTPDYVAWVPLAPGERYYGRGDFGRNSVNITNINVTQVNITNVYRNVNINNGVTVINRNTFNTASPTIVNVNRNVIQQNIFVKNNMSAGPPAINPARGSYFASSRPIPPAKLPPQPIRNLKPREIKQARPLIREPNRSVLNPNARVQPLQTTTVNQPRTPGRERPKLQNIQPTYRGRSEVIGTPGQRAVNPQVQPIDRGKGVMPAGQQPKREERLQPGANRPFGAAGSGVTGAKPQVQTIERGRPGVPAAQQPRMEQRQYPPVGNRQLGVPGGNGPTQVNPQRSAIEKGKTAAPAGQQPRLEQQQYQPAGNGRFGAPVAGAPAGSGSTVINPQLGTFERGKAVAPAGQQPRLEQRQFQPAGNGRFGAPGAGAPAGNQQIRTIERGKGAAPAVVAPKGENPKVKGMEKGRGAAPGTPAVKGGKIQVQPPEKGERGVPNGAAGSRGEKRPVDQSEGKK